MTRFAITLSFVLSIACTSPAAVPVVVQSNSQVGALDGEIFGLGNGYGGPQHDYTKPFDGKTDTWFDCYDTPGIDIKNDCYSGLKLHKPAAIGEIRYFPRANCPGCQTGGNPGCSLPGADRDKGGCRMYGGTFEGGQSATGPWTQLAKIEALPPEDAWSKLSVTDPTLYAFVRYMSPPGGYCNVAEIAFFAPNSWGWTLIAIILLGSIGYISVGMAIKFRSGKHGLKALPHLDMWLDLKGLVEDGIALSTGIRLRSTRRRGEAPVANSARATPHKKQDQHKPDKQKSQSPKQSRKKKGGGARHQESLLSVPQSKPPTNVVEESPTNLGRQESEHFDAFGRVLLR